MLTATNNILPRLMLAALAWAIAGNITQAQPDYEDEVLPAVKEKPKHVSYPLLLEYQRHYPKHANTYYQLGHIAMDYAKSFDPFTEYNDVAYFIYHTKVYFGLCKNYMDKKEARKNGDYYQGVEKKEDNWFFKQEDIIPVIDKYLEEIKTYEKNVNILRHHYNKSVTNYHQCVNIFREINASHNKIKTIYMSAYDDFNSKAKDLRSHFDSTIHYLDKYRQALNTYPLEGYNQQYKLKDIKTYRLQGLTNSNFLQNDISLWNYNGWLDSLYHVIHHEVKPLRRNIAQTAGKINDHANWLADNNASDSLLNYTLPRKLAFKIEKYDYQSLMLRFLRYKSGWLRYRAILSQPENEPAYYSFNKDYSQLANYYMEAIEKQQEADSLLQDFYSHIRPEDVYKYKQFFNNRIGNAEALRQYAQEQQKSNSSMQAKALDNLKAGMISYLQRFPNDTAAVTHDEWPVHLQKMPQRLDSTGSFNPLDIKKHEGFYYLTGYYRGKDKSAGAWVAEVDKEHQLRWLKKMPANEMDEAGITLDIGENSIYVLTGQYTENGGLHSSHLYQFSRKGEAGEKQKLPYKRSPRYLIYDDINQTLMMAFKDTTLAPNTATADTLTLSLQNAALDSVHWEKQLQLKGNLVDVLLMDTTYLAFCNYASFTSPKTGELVQSAENGGVIGDAMAVKIGLNGTMPGIVRYKKNKPVCITKAVKINSRRINLQGMQSTYYNILDKPDKQDVPFFYSLLNKQAQEIFSNRQQNALK